MSPIATDPATTTRELDATASTPVDTDDLGVDDELLVEEISIDGMCGVY